MYAIEEKTKNMFSFDDTVSKLEGLNLFITASSFSELENKFQSELDEVKQIKD